MPAPTLNPAFNADAWLNPHEPLPTADPIHWPLWAACLLAAFLAGAIPFGLLVARLRGIDIRAHGSGNIGATNVGRVLGFRYFLIVFALDMLKGLLPTLAAGLALGWAGSLSLQTNQGFALPTLPALLWLAVMLATVLGHMYTPFAGFKGGKGVATGLGALLGLFPVLTAPALASFGVFLITIALWRTVSLSSMLAAGTLPLWVWYAFELAQRIATTPRLSPADPAALLQTPAPTFHPWPWLAVTALVAALVIYKHRSNLRRLMAGTEPRIGATRSKPADA